MTSEKPTIDSHELARKAALFGLEKKAGKPVVLDLRGFDFLCDYYVVMDGESEPQIKAIVEHIEEGLKGLGEDPWHIEGRQGGQWVLLDYVHVVIHVFRRDTRELYLLERLWGDAPTEVVDA